MKINRNFKMLFFAVLSGLIEGMSHAYFVVPAKIFPGGFSGISRLVSQTLSVYRNIEIPYELIYFILNVIAVLIVFKEIGKKFTVFSLIEVGITSFVIGNYKPVIEVNDLLLMSVFGGIVTGFACGIALSNDFSAGGTDFLTVYFSNKYKKSLWNYTLALNVCILSIAGILYGWEIAMYSIIYQYVATQVIKTMHKRYTHQTINIYTSKKDEVIASILKDTRHGITITEAIGAYKQQKVYVLTTIVNTFQTKTVIDSALTADSNAFINIQNTVEIKGNYFQKPLD